MTIGNNYHKAGVVKQARGEVLLVKREKILRIQPEAGFESRTLIIWMFIVIERRLYTRALFFICLTVLVGQSLSFEFVAFITPKVPTRVVSSATILAWMKNPLKVESRGPGRAYKVTVWITILLYYDNTKNNRLIFNTIAISTPLSFQVCPRHAIDD